MTVKYIFDVEELNKMIKEKEVEGIEIVEADKYEEIEINVDFEENKADVWGNKYGSSEFLNDVVTINDLEALEERASGKEIHEMYLSNVEIAHYIETLGIPFNWALESLDEWRTSEKEEEEIEDKEIWEAIDGIKMAWEISCEEKLTS